MIRSLSVPEHSYIGETMKNPEQDAELKILGIRRKVEDGFYFSKRIYELIAEKVMKDFFYRK